MTKDPTVISFSGKGGSGKTTTASLFLAGILNKYKSKDILVIDADPDANLSNTLQVNVKKTVGQMLDQQNFTLQGSEKDHQKFRFAFYDLICVKDGFDFLAMGRTGGMGCYCALNSALEKILNETLKMYDLVLIDFDAGLEHFSRKAGNALDTLIITCDASRMSLDTARRIRALIDELSLPYERQYVIGCKLDDKQKSIMKNNAKEMGFDILGFIPFDHEIADRNLLGRDLLSIEETNPAFSAANCLLSEVLS
jgi:CO dehydrogenase maturation factor